MQEALNPIYEVEIACPVCKKNFKAYKLRSKAYRKIGEDSDLCPIYEGYNPLFYDAWVCNSCGYANIPVGFSELNDREKNTIREKISSKWTNRSIKAERSLEDALFVYKLVLLNHQVRTAKYSELAKLCHRIAWLNRIKGDCVDEYKFLKYAEEYYEKTYSSEEFPAGNLDEYACVYLIAELNRRLENLDKSIMWFGILIQDSLVPEKKKKISPKLLEDAKDMIQEIKIKKKQQELEDKKDKKK